MNKFTLHVKKLCEQINEIEIFLDNVNNQKKVVTELTAIKDILEEEKLVSVIKYEDGIEALFNSAVQYNAIIISVYGSFEYFIDSIFNEYINEVYKVCQTYEELPQKMREKHMRKAGEYLSNPHRFNGYELTSGDVINNIYRCIFNESDSKLVMPLLLSHGGNMNIDQIIELMSDLGIDNAREKITSNIFFKEYYMDLEGYSETTVETFIKEKDSSIFNQLSELVQERNNVAHGWVVENRIAYDKIKDEILKFIKCLANTICDVLINEYFDKLFSINKLENFDTALAIYNNNILCINSKDANLSLGDYIYAKKDNGNSLALKIKDIQINNVSCKSIEGGNINIGLKVNRRIKDTYSFYYINNNQT